MQFFTSLERLNAEGSGPCAYLRPVPWNDWFKYSTKFELFLWDASQGRHALGVVKIGCERMSPPAPSTTGFASPSLPEVFTMLDSSYYSLGQDDNYYETLNTLPLEIKTAVLRGLRDVAYQPSIISKLKNLDVLNDSVLRSFEESDVRSRIHLLAHDRTAVTAFSFRYESGSPNGSSPYSLEFDASVKSVPPSNIHVLIGRNGVGKTHCLQNIALSLSAPDKTPARLSAGGAAPQDGGRMFRQVILVSFSAFDPFVPIDETDTDADEQNRQNRQNRQNQNIARDRPKYYYIGLKSPRRHYSPEPMGSGQVSEDAEDTGDRVSIESKAIEESFREAVNKCSVGLRRNRWASLLEVLRSDPVFSRSKMFDLLSLPPTKDISDLAAKIFSKLSSGHKIVLLIVTRLVALTTEKTLILLDEPEAHLHPPLTASLVRCLSQFLSDRNGVAIIATHSPVVLREAPSSCVYKFRRVGKSTIVERPKIETFGGSIGILTDEVFEHEVTTSGFYGILKKVASRSPSYDSAVAKFNGKLSGHGKAILRMMSFKGEG